MTQPDYGSLLTSLWPYGLALSRWTAFLLAMPGFGEFFLSPRIRVLLALGMSACVTPLLLEQGALVATLSLGGLLQEVGIGLFLGLLVRLLVEMMSMAGGIISHEVSLTNMLSGFFESESSDVIHSFLKIYFITLIFVVDLHLLFIKGLYQSYSFFPPGEPLIFQDMTTLVVAWVSDGFRVAVQMSAPFLIVGLCYHVLLGLMGRLVPQVPFFFVTRPFEIGLGLLGLFLSLMAIFTLFQETLESLFGGFLGG